MRKFLTLLAAVLFLGACARDDEHVLKVYNWIDYIDESVIPEFEAWYEEQTGEPVHVDYHVFEINEKMLSQIEKERVSFDVFCPSDYIIERLLKSDLLLPIGHDFGATPNYIDAHISPFVRSCFDKLEGGGKNANDYAVGYMWGTTGILYNGQYVTDEEASTWDVLRNPKFADKIFIKDSPHDVFSHVILYLRHEDVEAGKVTMDELMHDSSDAALRAFETYMKQVSPLVAGWESDFGKDQMTQERGWISMNWSGDALLAIEEGREKGVDLRYVCPKEGFAVWMDGWVIPKFAKNTQAARYWIDFLCRPDIIIRNVAVTGYVSASNAPEILEAFTNEKHQPIDLSYFFGPDATACRVNPILYPPREEIDRSTMEHDWGDRSQALSAVWRRAKGETTIVTSIIIFGILFLVAVILTLLQRMTTKKDEA